MFDSQRIKGAIPAMLTPLTDDEGVDENGLRRLVRFLLERGVHGIFTLGSSGEFPALLPEERRDVIGIVVDEVGGRVPVLAGVSDSGTKKVIANTRVAQEMGADVGVALPTYYLAGTEREMVRHYQAILAETDLPILLYNNPPSTDVRITLSVLDQLAENPRVVGIKDSSGDFAFFQQILRRFRTHPRFRVVQGHEGYAAVSFLLGGHAGHLGLANVVPQLFVQLYEVAVAGRTEEAMALQGKIDDVARIWEVGGATDASYFNSMKTALNLFGVCGVGVSRPYVPFSAEETSQVEAILRQNNLLPVTQAAG